MNFHQVAVLANLALTVWWLEAQFHTKREIIYFLGSDFFSIFCWSEASCEFFQRNAFRSFPTLNWLSKEARRSELLSCVLAGASLESRLDRAFSVCWCFLAEFSFRWAEAGPCWSLQRHTPISTWFHHVDEYILLELHVLYIIYFNEETLFP